LVPQEERIQAGEERWERREKKKAEEREKVMMGVNTLPRVENFFNLPWPLSHPTLPCFWCFLVLASVTCRSRPLQVFTEDKEG
jgi:hypothetical protein